MSKCMMSWCGGEREGRDMGGALATPPRENMESPDLREEPVQQYTCKHGTDLACTPELTLSLVSTSEKKSGDETHFYIMLNKTKNVSRILSMVK